MICRPNVLELGAVDRELIDRLDVLLLGTRLVMALLEMLLLGALLVIDLLEMLLLGVRLIMDLLELLVLGVLLVMALLELLLGVRLVIARFELRLDETLLEMLEEVDLDVELGAGAGLEACWLCLLELLDLLLLDRVLAAITGSQNNKRANRIQEIRKSEPSRRDSPKGVLRTDFRLPASDFCLLSSEFCIVVNIIRLLSSAFTL